MKYIDCSSLNIIDRWKLISIYILCIIILCVCSFPMYIKSAMCNLRICNKFNWIELSNPFVRPWFCPVVKISLKKLKADHDLMAVRW